MSIVSMSIRGSKRTMFPSCYLEFAAGKFYNQQVVLYLELMPASPLPPCNTWTPAPPLEANGAINPKTTCHLPQA